MASVVVTPTAVADLARLITTHSLPVNTIPRFKRSVASLGRCTQLGAPLQGRWTNYRFVLGPWRWMLVVYIYDEFLDRVAIAAVQDARGSQAATWVA